MASFANAGGIGSYYETEFTALDGRNLARGRQRNNSFAGKEGYVSVQVSLALFSRPLDRRTELRAHCEHHHRS